MISLAISLWRIAAGGVSAADVVAGFPDNNTGASEYLIIL